MSGISNNSGAFGKRTSPSTQELVDDIVASQLPAEGVEVETVTETETQQGPELKPCCRKLETKEVVVVALAAIVAWEIIKSIFKN